MKVKELIEKLQAFDGDDLVIEALDTDMTEWSDDLPGIVIFRPEQCEVDTYLSKYITHYIPRKGDAHKGRFP